MVQKFQQTVNAQPAPAVEGDFASANPRRTLLAGAGALVSGPLGVTIGKFAFAAVATGIVTSAHPGVASQIGFVGRDQVSLISDLLASSSMTTYPGTEITLFDGGDFWGRFAAGATVGQKVFAKYTDGSLVAGTSGSPPAGASFTGVIAASVLTASAVTGTIAPGQPLTGTGVTAGSYVGPQLTGTAGGAGTYGVVGTTTASSTAMTTTSAVETAFTVGSACLSGELAKITTARQV